VNPDQVFGLVFVLACGTIIPLALVFGIPVAKALARRIEAGVGAKEAVPPEELEELRQRVGELEERVDFTERVLARQQEPERLGKGET
jgi:hypothetical protein